MLTLVVNQLKLLNNSILGENGAIILYGIDRLCHEIKEIILPPKPVLEFRYECSKKFNTEQFEHLFKSSAFGHVIFISGQNCVIFEYDGSWKKIKSLSANLIKRHHKGGQSSVRFSRLAEESRAIYVTHVVDWINQLITSDHNNYVFGGNELKNLLISNASLKIHLITDDKYYTFDDTTIYDEYFKTLICNPVFSENTKINQIVEYIERNPDYLLFSKDEIVENLDDVEYIILINNNGNIDIKSFGNKNVIILPTNHHLYGKLKSYNVIGKLYYISPKEKY